MVVGPVPCPAQEDAPSLQVELLPDFDIRLSWTNANAVVEELDVLSSTNVWRPLARTPLLSHARYALHLLFNTGRVTIAGNPLCDPGAGLLIHRGDTSIAGNGILGGQDAERCGR